ncbi:unnamed protein product, partial [Discosporangium mesarthrocarpum]
LQDSDEFSDGEFEDSGFEESVGPGQRKKERTLQNDKYDMALEVSASASMDADEMGELRGAAEQAKQENTLKNSKFDETVSASMDYLSADVGSQHASGKAQAETAARGGRDVKNEQFDAAYDLSSGDEESSMDTRESAHQAATKKITISAPSRSPKETANAGGTSSSGVASATAVASSAPAMGSIGGRMGGGSDRSESGSETSSNDDRSSPLKVEGAYNPADYAHLNVSAEIKDLFQYIGRYKTHEVELDTTLRCFVPDYIPAVGDMDAFLKVPRPDEATEDLGFKVLDEPAANQSDATVLELQLRAMSKKRHGDVAVRSIENAHKNPEAIKRWVQSITDMHRTKPPPQVHYKKNMPDIEKLMEAWPPEFEEVLGNVNLLTPDLEMSLEEYARMMCAIMDIPVYDNLLESLHVLFTTYMEFKSNPHFMQLGSGSG